MGGGAWWAAVHGVAKSRTRLSDFTFTFHFHALEKEMATHSSVLSWRIPGTAEPGGLPSMGSHRVRHDWSDLAAAEEIVGSDGEERMVKKTFPAVWINKKCHSHLLFLASKCEWGLLKLWSWGCCYPPWWLLRSWGMWEIKTTRCWPQTAEMLKEGVTSIIPDSCIFPYIEEC